MALSTTVGNLTIPSEVEVIPTNCFKGTPYPNQISCSNDSKLKEIGGSQ